MHNSKWLALLLILVGVRTSAAIHVSFEKTARTGDPVPGRETLPVVFNGRAFQTRVPGVLSQPLINGAGQVSFIACSTVAADFNQLSTIGSYLKSPGVPLDPIFDQSDNTAINTVGTGAPFAVLRESFAAISDRIQRFAVAPTAGAAWMMPRPKERSVICKRGKG